MKKLSLLFSFLHI